MQFSVLLSVYYKEKPNYLKQALNSVVKQTFSPNEIVLIKDGPLTSELEEVIKHFEEKHPSLFNIISLEENKGLGKALQIGVKACSYDIIARMDSDDICVSERFERQIAFLQKNPHISIVGSNIAEFTNSPQEIVSHRKLPLTPEKTYKFAKTRCPLNHMSVIFRKKDILEVGNYKPFTLFEDYYLWVRVLNKGYKIANLNESLVLVNINNMHQKRRGLKYIKTEILLQKEFHKMGFISIYKMLFNIIFRNTPRLFPLFLLKWFYTSLRK